MISFLAHLQKAKAQSWTISGNSNANNGSKLGTTNANPLRFFTNNSERLRIDASGKVGIGTSSPLNILTVKLNGTIPAASWLAGGGSLPAFLAFGENQATGFNLATAANSSGYRPVLNTRRSRGTLAAPTAVANNDYLASFVSSGFDGNTFQNPATIDFYVDGATSPGNVPGRISFVTGTNAGNRVERLKVGSTGNFNFNNDQLFLRQSDGLVGIGTARPGARLHVFKASAGAVTGYNDAPLIVENSTHDYINILAPDVSETGILFGKPANNISGGLIYNSSDNLNGFQFRTNGNSTKMVLTDNGNVGIGTTSPGFYRLKISGSGGNSSLDIEQSSTLDDWELHTEGPALGGSATQGDLDLFYNTNFKGSFEHTNGNYYSISDERLKTNIKPMSSMLEKINQLKPSVYQFKNTTDKQEYDGFIAQEVIKIFPGLVMHTLIPDRNLDVYTMNYSGFGVIAIKGIQELQPVLEEQNQKIIALEGAYQLKITSLEERIEKLEEALVAFTSNNEKSMSFITGNGSLAQNKPNPFFKNTAIRYNIGKGSKGQISIYDETGKLVKVFNTNDNGMLQVSANDFAAGTYTYTLKIDGKVSSSKQMVLMK